MKSLMKSLFCGIKPKDALTILVSNVVMAFGVYQVHSQSGVTEGGVMGMALLLKNWFDLSPAISGMVMDLLCYFLGWKLLGRKFILLSLISTVGFSASYSVFEQFDPLFPQLAHMPLTAAVVGALFVGICAGLCVRAGSAPGGDDALAMSLSHLTHIHIQWIYLLSDASVLALSLTYIPLKRIIYSLLTVFLSGQIIGLMQKTENNECSDDSCGHCC